MNPNMERKDEKFTIVKKFRPPRIVQEDGEKKVMAKGRALGGMSRGKSKGAVGKLSLPPQIENTLIVRSRIRYIAGSGSIVSVSVQDLVGALGGVCTVTNSVFKPWSGSVRLRKVIAWPSANIGAETTAALSWNSGVSGLNKDSEKTADTPEGVSNTGCVVFFASKEVCGFRLDGGVNWYD